MQYLVTTHISPRGAKSLLGARVKLQTRYYKIYTGKEMSILSVEIAELTVIAIEGVQKSSCHVLIKTQYLIQSRS